MDYIDQLTLKNPDLQSLQTCSLFQSKDTELNQETELFHIVEDQQIRYEIPAMNRDTLTTGGAAVTVIMAVSFLVRSFALLVKTVRD